MKWFKVSTNILYSVDMEKAIEQEGHIAFTVYMALACNHYSDSPLTMKGLSALLNIRPHRMTKALNALHRCGLTKKNGAPVSDYRKLISGRIGSVADHSEKNTQNSGTSVQSRSGYTPPLPHYRKLISGRIGSVADHSKKSAQSGTSSTRAYPSKSNININHLDSISNNTQLKTLESSLEQAPSDHKKLTIKIDILHLQNKDASFNDDGGWKTALQHKAIKLLLQKGSYKECVKRYTNMLLHKFYNPQASPDKCNRYWHEFNNAPKGSNAIKKISYSSNDFTENNINKGKMRGI